jgi:hypothetical protein
LLAHAFEAVGGYVQEPGLACVGHRGQHDQVAEPVQQVRGEPARVMPALDHPVHRVEHRRPVLGRERVGDVVKQAVIGIAEQRDRPLVTQA